MATFYDQWGQTVWILIRTNPLNSSFILQRGKFRKLIIVCPV